MIRVIQRLKDYFDPYIPTQIDDWKQLLPNMQKMKIPNRTLIKASGATEHHLRFILSGAGALLIEDDGKEICLDLCFEDDFLTDFESLNNQVPTQIYIKNFEPMEVVIIEQKFLFKIYKSSVLGARIGKVLAEQQTVRSQKRQIDNYVGKKTEERYKQLLENRPQILLRTPQHYVASYLGVSAPTLSRLRKNME